MAAWLTCLPTRPHFPAQDRRVLRLTRTSGSARSATGRESAGMGRTTIPMDAGTTAAGRGMRRRARGGVVHERAHGDCTRAHTPPCTHAWITTWDLDLAPRGNMPAGRHARAPRRHAPPHAPCTTAWCPPATQAPAGAGPGHGAWAQVGLLQGHQACGGGRGGWQDVGLLQVGLSPLRLAIALLFALGLRVAGNRLVATTTAPHIFGLPIVWIKVVVL
jgi:hypothetical protein